MTTRRIDSAAQAEECLRWYCLRWRIEDWHRVLKSGCRIEALQHQTAERLKRAIAIHMVIAWHIMLMTLLGGNALNSPPRSCSRISRSGCWSRTQKNGIAGPIHLGNAVLLVARLGGHIGRPGDPPPGHQIMWRGYAHLHAMCDGFSLKDWTVG